MFNKVFSIFFFFLALGFPHFIARLFIYREKTARGFIRLNGNGMCPKIEKKDWYFFREKITTRNLELKSKIKNDSNNVALAAFEAASESAGLK